MKDLNTLKDHIKDELQPARERGKYICPICCSGDHGPGSTAAFSIDRDGIHGHCFACGFHGDIFDLVAARDNISKNEATKRLIEKYNPREIAAAAQKSTQPYRAKPSGDPQTNFLADMVQAHAALAGSEGDAYLKGRGLTDETLERFQLGYCPDHYFPGAHKSLPAIMFPYDRGCHYVGWRAIPEKHYDKPKTAEAGDEPCFNAAALYQGGPCFVVESQLCAISIEQEGGRAVSIGGSGSRKLMLQLDKKKPAGPLILSLDNDEAGRSAQTKLAAELEAKGIPFLQANIADECKDPNELLSVDRSALRENIAEILRGVDQIKAREEQARIEARQQESAAGYLDNFLEELRQTKAAPAIPTGFKALDRLLDGGLYPGLYVIGAITSLGKSTFTLQIADNIAAGGHDVLCFNLEMARRELIAKSVSRISYQIAREQTRKGLSVRDIMNAQKWQSLGKKGLELMAAALEQYKATSAPHIWHYEAIGDLGAEQIRAEVERHIGITGRLPVVVVDYLQILASPNVRLSDKQAVDKNVLELKRLSRDKSIPVFAISSLNRDNYLNPINNAAFKESGAVEYSSDCLMGLQFLGMDYQEGEADKAREKRIRELIKQQKAAGNKGKAEKIEIKILKNRNGMAGTSEVLMYTPRYNHYEEEITEHYEEEFTEVDDAGLPDEWKEEPRKRRPL